MRFRKTPFKALYRIIFGGNIGLARLVAFKILCQKLGKKLRLIYDGITIIEGTVLLKNKNLMRL